MSLHGSLQKALQIMVEKAIIRSLNQHEHTVVTRSIQFTATTIQHVQIADGLQYPPSPKRFKKSIQDEHPVETDEWTAQKHSWGPPTMQRQKDML